MPNGQYDRSPRSRLTFASLTFCVGASYYRQYDCLRLRAGFWTVGSDSSLDVMVGRRRHFSRLLHVPAFCHVRRFSLYASRNHPLPRRIVAAPC